MIFNTDTSEKTAELLLQINAIKLNPKNPYTWASGWKSPIYCDNRMVLSFPVVRNYIRSEFAKNIENEFGKPDVIVGVATGAIGIGALVAEHLGLPFVYIRTEPKKHGRQNRIEGLLQKGQTVVVIEDLISTGNSSLQAVEVLRKAGAIVKGLVAIFTYGFDIASENFKKAGVCFYTLGDYETLLKKALNKKYITENQQKMLQEWSVSPSTWGML